MKHVGIVFLYELRRNLSRKGYLFSTFGLPLLGLVLLLGYHVYQTYLANPTQEDVNILGALTLESIEQAGYVDLSGEFAAIPEGIQDVLRPYASESAARAALEAGEIDAFFVMESDYLESGRAILHLPSLQLMVLEDGETLIQQLVYRTFVPDVDGQIIARLTNEPVINEFDLTQSDTNGSSSAMENGRFMVIYAFTMVFFIGLMMTNSYLMQTVIEERENKLIEILVSAVQPVHLLAGKILALGGLGIFQIAVWIGSVVLLTTVAGSLSSVQPLLASLNLQFSSDLLPVMAAYFVLMYLLYAAVFGAIGAISNSTQEGSQYVGLLVIPTIIPFYFFALIEAEPNGTLALIFSMIPFTAPVTMMIRMIASTVPAWQLLLSIGLMVLTTIGAMWLAGRLFRVQTLLSGQSFKLKDIPRLLAAGRTR